MLCKCLSCFEAVSGRLVVPKLGTELLEYFEPVLDNVGTVLGGYVIIYAINYVLVCIRPEMAMDFGSTSGIGA